MTEQEHLLTCLAEELGEAQHAIFKSLRFGLETQPVSEKQLVSNEDYLRAELGDVEAVLEMLAERGVHLWPGKSANQRNKKKEKVRLFMEKARAEGLIT